MTDYELTVKDARHRLEQMKGERDQIKKSITQAESRIKLAKVDLRKYEQSREVIRQVAIKTQEQLSYNVSEITTMALNAVLANPYDLILEFTERRNKTECDILFAREGITIAPYDGGGGAVDVASFALRVASWSMTKPRSRNVLILDEPFKHLKGEGANRRMLEMVKEVSDRLGIQIIMVSDERVSRGATIEATDLLIETSIKNGITKINIE